MTDIVERLRSNELLPVCPYDRRSPDYWTAPNDGPCVVCGQENTIEGPDLCRGADTRVMAEAAAEIERLRAQPRYFTGCLRDGVCRGVCKTADCPNYDLVVAARLVVEKQEEGIVYP